MKGKDDYTIKGENGYLCSFNRMVMKGLLIALFLMTFTASETLTGRVVRVTDGDTITILTAGNKQERIRSMKALP